MPGMSVKSFDKLSRRDFDNGAVLDDIRDGLSQRQALLEWLDTMTDYQRGYTVGFKSRDKEMESVTTQRDALLEAIKNLVEFLETGNPPEEGGSLLGRGFIQAKTAIAMCEKETA